MKFPTRLPRRWPTLVLAPLLFLSGWTAVFYVQTNVHQQAVMVQARTVASLADVEYLLTRQPVSPDVHRPVREALTQSRAQLAGGLGLVASRWGQMVRLIWMTYLALFAGAIVLHVGLVREKVREADAESRRQRREHERASLRATGPIALATPAEPAVSAESVVPEGQAFPTMRLVEPVASAPAVLAPTAPVPIVPVPIAEEGPEAERLKEIMFSNLNHEMRTPLTIILGYASMLEAEANPEQRSLVEAIRLGGERLLGTLNDFLDLAALDQGRIDFDEARLDLRTALAETIKQKAPKAAEKGLQLVYQAPKVPMLVRADREALGRIAAHLVDNAIKFTTEGVVHLSLEAIADKVRIHVRDTGAGIDPAFLPHLFDPFRQESDGHTRSYGGIGIGLTIVRRLVEGMNGSVSVASEKGGGTRFTVTFPRASAHVRALPRAA